MTEKLTRRQALKWLLPFLGSISAGAALGTRPHKASGAALYLDPDNVPLDPASDVIINEAGDDFGQFIIRGDAADLITLDTADDSVLLDNLRLPVSGDYYSGNYEIQVIASSSPPAVPFIPVQRSADFQGKTLYVTFPDWPPSSPTPTPTVTPTATATAVPPILEDTFTGIAGELAAHSPDIDPGGGWSELRGDWELDGSGNAINQTGTGATERYTSAVDCAISDGILRLHLRSASGRYVGGLAFRVQDANNKWEAAIYFNSGVADQFSLNEYVSNVPTTRDSESGIGLAYDTDYIIEVIIADDAISATLMDSGETVLSSLSYTSSYLQTETEHGITEMRRTTPNTFYGLLYDYIRMDA